MPSIMSIVFDCYAFKPLFWICLSERNCNNSCFTLNAIFSLGIIPPTIIVPVFLYLMLYIKAKKAKAKTIPAANDKTSSREWKAIFTFFLLFLAVFIVTIPTLIVIVITHYLYGDGDLPPLMHFVNVIFACVSSLLVITDPLVILRNRDIREILQGIKTKIINKRFPSTQGQKIEMKTTNRQRE